MINRTIVGIVFFGLIHLVTIVNDFSQASASELRIRHHRVNMSRFAY